jgi:hypothetical protein
MTGEEHAAAPTAATRMAERFCAGSVMELQDVGATQRVPMITEFVTAHGFAGAQYVSTAPAIDSPAPVPNRSTRCPRRSTPVRAAA